MPDDKDVTILREGYQPAEVEQRGYQPHGSQKPEGQNPPSGGSNVSTPNQTGGSEKKE